MGEYLPVALVAAGVGAVVYTAANKKPRGPKMPGGKFTSTGSDEVHRSRARSAYWRDSAAAAMANDPVKPIEYEAGPYTAQQVAYRDYRDAKGSWHLAHRRGKSQRLKDPYRTLPKKSPMRR
jgi:hypothetical protein